MAGVYRPKIKIDTVRDVARKMVATKTGQQISQTKFKQFLKTDKNLRGMAIKGGASHITKTQAQKFFGSVVKKVDQEKNMKLSMFSRKMGVKASPQGEVSSVGLKKVYQSGAEQEIKAETHVGASKEEIERQQRIERGRQIMNRRDRAEEIRKEYQARTTPQKQAPQCQPTQLTHGSAAARLGQNDLASSLSKQSPPQRQLSSGSLKSQRDRDANAVILSFHNTSRMQELDLLGEKLEETLRRALASVLILRMMPKVSTMKALRTLGWQPGNVVTPEFAKKIGNRLAVEYIFFGSLKHQPTGVHVEQFLFLISDNSLLKIAELTEDFRKTFEIERKLMWQVQKFFEEKNQRRNTGSDVSVPSPAEAEDLPI